MKTRLSIFVIVIFGTLFCASLGPSLASRTNSQSSERSTATQSLSSVALNHAYNRSMGVISQASPTTAGTTKTASNLKSTSSSLTTTLNLSEDLVSLGIAATNMVPNQPSLDAGPLFVQGVAYAMSHQMSTVVADKGTYYFLTLQTPGVHVQLGGNPTVPLVSNLTIDFQGSDLIFTHPLLYGISLFGASNVVLQNFTADYQPLPFTQVRVVAVDPSTARIQYSVEPGWQDPSAFNSAQQLPGAGFPTVEAHVFRNGRRAVGTIRMAVQTPLNGNTFTLVPYMNFTPTPANVAKIRPGDVVVLVMRQSAAPVVTYRCHGCTLRNISVYAASGEAITGMYSDSTTWERIYSIPKPGTDRLMSSLEIGFQVAGPNNQIRLSRAIRTVDSGISLYAWSTGEVESQQSARTLTVAGVCCTTLGQGVTLANGSPVVFQSRADGAILASAVLVSQTGSVDAYNPDHLSYTFDRDLPGNLVGSLIYTTDFNQRGSNSLIERNTVQEGETTGMDIYGWTGSTVHGNYFNRSAFAAILGVASTAPNSAWDTPPLENMTFSNNVMDRGNQAAEWWLPEMGAIEMETVRWDAQQGDYDLMPGAHHQNIAMAGNFIDDPGRAAIWIGGTSGANVTGNYLLHPNERPTLGVYHPPRTDVVAPLIVDPTSNGIATANNTIDQTSGRVFVTDTQSRELAAYPPGGTLRLSAYNVGTLANPAVMLTDADGVTIPVTIQATSAHALDVQIPAGAALGGAYVTLTSGATKYFGTLFIDNQDNIPAVNGCTYETSMSSTSVPNTGGSVPILVVTQAGCSYPANDPDPFVTINGGGTGTSVISANFKPNTLTSRSTTLEIAGVPITFTQAAAATPTLNLSQDLVSLGIASTNMVPNQPSLDAGPLFLQGVQYAKSHGITTVVADPGAYYLLSLTEPNAHFALRNIDNMTIDLHGADLIFTHPLYYGLIVYYSNNAVIENFTADYQPLPFTQVRVTSVDTVNAKIQYVVEPGWPDPSTFNTLSRFAGQPVPEVQVHMFRTGRRVLGRLFTQLPLPGGGNFPIVNTDSGTHLGDVRVGDVAVVALRSFTNPVATNHCSGCTLRNITVFSSAEDAVHAQDTQNSVIERVYAIPKPGTDRLVSASAGIMMFPVDGPNNEIRLSRAIRTLDDGLALVGRFVGTVQSQTSARVLVVDGSGGPTILGDGDTIPNGLPVTFQRYSDGVVVASAVIVSATAPAASYPHQTAVTFDRDLPPGVVGAVAYTTDANQNGANSVVERSLIQEPFGRLYIGGIANGTARGNYIRHTAMAGIFLYQSTAAGDPPTAPLTNMTISNNVIDGANMTSNWWWYQFGGISSVTLTTAYDLMAVSTFSNLQITNNFIADSGRSGIWLGNTSGGSVSSNYILNANTRPDLANAYQPRIADASKPLVIDTTSNGVTTSSNTIDNTSSQMFVTDTQYRELAAYAPGAIIRLNAYGMGGLANPAVMLTDADGVTTPVTIQATSAHALDVQIPAGAALGGAYVTLTSGATKYFGTLFVDSQDNIPALNGCTYETSVSSTSVPNTGGSVPILVITQTGCSYPTTDPDSFVTTGVSGTGTSITSVTFAANSGAARNSTLEIAGIPISLTQAAAPSPTPTPTPNVVQFSAANYNVQEDCTTVTITVNRLGDTSAAASVNYNTSDVTATERKDYITAFGTLQFAPGETSKSFVVLINEDSLVEGNETFNVNLSNPSGVSLGSPAIATVTIIDDPSEPATNAIDDPRTFVCQHYHDFLNRQPDQSGWDFWTAQITSCGTDQACIGVKRVNVSGAYFLSIEFQNTGYLVERMYKAAYGDAQQTSTFGGSHSISVPTVRLSEFLADVQQISNGVIVGQPGWQQQLANNKFAFSQTFVQRSRFATAYGTSMTPAQFVQALADKAGVPANDPDRAKAVSEFGAVSDTSNVAARGRALRDIAENASVSNSEQNRAFVLMQYFGYLRRDPNSGPDTDYTGYDFWLTKLNQFNGDYIAAEMVKAFISSNEYRQRFGP